MVKKIPVILAICFLSGNAFGMYGEDTEPREENASYTKDKESPSSITKPEIETTMPIPQQDIMFDETDNPEEEYIERNLTEDEFKDRR